MKTIWALTVSALLIAPASAQTTIADPLAFVKSVYAHWNMSQPEPKDVFSPHLAALMALDTKEAKGEVGRADDFSIWCNCQDGDLTNVAIKDWSVYGAAPARHVVDVKFLLDGKKEELLFYFEKTLTGWKIDDVQSLATDPWTLSVLCKYGSPSGR